jgi:hypothetical protein
MTRTPHTKGPWALSQYRHGLRIVSEDHPSVDENAIICELEPEEVFGTTEEIKANARLIAAAPDLLAALKEAAAQFRWYVELHNAKGDDPLARQKAERNEAMARKCEAAIELAEQAA